MGLTLANLDTRFQQLIGDASSGEQTNRYQALADADVELSSIRGIWRTRGFTYTSSSSPAMASGSYQLAVPTSPAFESPYRLYYRDSGLVQDVIFKSRSEWLALSDTSQSDYPRWASLRRTATAFQIELDRKLSSAFVSTIAALELEYWIEITRLASGTDESILPDSLRHYILPVAAVRYAAGQGDRELVALMLPLAEAAREAVLRFDIEHTSRPRQVRPSMAYAPSDGDEGRGDYS